MLEFQVSSFDWWAGHLNLVKKSGQRYTRHIQALKLSVGSGVQLCETVCEKNM